MADLLCACCSTPGLSLFQTRDYNRRISAEKFIYYKCPSCGLVYLVNVPEDLGKYYPANYYNIPTNKEMLITISSQEQYKLDIIKKIINKGKLLEVGPAWGAFAYLAKQSGFDVNVIEMDKKCCSFIQNELKIKAIQSCNTVKAFEDLPSYDVITFWHVIEHLSDPWATLKAAADKLLPGGVLVVATPNPDAFQFQILKQFWTHVDAPRHLTIIPYTLLARRLEEIGLTCVRATTRDIGSLGWNSFGWAVSLQSLFKVNSLRCIAHFTGRLLTKIVIPIERSDWRGSCYTAIFQKGHGI